MIWTPPTDDKGAHFHGLVVVHENLAFKVDNGHDSTVMHHAELRHMSQWAGLKLFRALPVAQAAFSAGSWVPPWVRDVEGGAGKKPAAHSEAQKKPSAFTAMSPKKGKDRLIQRGLATKRHTKLYTCTPYVRDATTPACRRDRQTWSTSLKAILGMTEAQLVRMCVRDGILDSLGGRSCPHCGAGKLGNLQPVAGRGLRYRCARKGCQKFALPWCKHPLFSVGSGISALPFKDQCAALFCLLSGATGATTHRILGDVNHKVVERMRSSLHAELTSFVEKKEEGVVFGTGDGWEDVEGDEAVFGKGTASDTADDLVSWEQWAGLVQRGKPETLILFRTNSCMTVPRAPGPGAITKVDYKQMADRYLKGRNVILHTDSAKAYALRVPGVLHDSVRHSKQRVKIGNKTVWKPACYTKLVTHKLPSGKSIRTKGGTQVIDRVWRFIRSKLVGQTKQPGTLKVRRAIRAAQWLYWKRDGDLWQEIGKVLAHNRMLC